MVLGEPRIPPRREAAAAFSSEFPQCVSDPSQPNIYFSGVSRLGSLLPGYLAFGRLFKQPYVIIGIRQHTFGAIPDDGFSANLDSIHDIHRAIDQDHRDCGALVIIDPHRSKPNLPSLRIANSLLVSRTSRHSLPKRGTKLSSDYIFRQRDAVNSYVGLGGLTECGAGQEKSEHQYFHIRK